jgi:hypothetical protein
MELRYKIVLLTERLMSNIIREVIVLLLTLRDKWLLINHLIIIIKRIVKYYF